jgi:hypothetical protein
LERSQQNHPIDAREQKCYDPLSVKDDAQVDDLSTLRPTADGTPTAVRGLRSVFYVENESTAP